MYENNLVMNQNTREIKKMNNKQIYQENMSPSQSSGRNRESRKALIVSYCDGTRIIVALIGLVLIIMGLNFWENDSQFMDSQSLNIPVFVGILLVVSNVLIMINRRVKIIGNRIIYTSMFRISHTFSLYDIEKVEIASYHKSPGEKIIITLDDCSFWITVDGCCQGYDELKKFFYHRGMLTVSGIIVRPFDYDYESGIDYEDYEDEYESGIDYEEEWDKLLR